MPTCTEGHKTDTLIREMFVHFFRDSDVFEGPTFEIIHDMGRVVGNGLDYDIVVSKFELQSRYYVHFEPIASEKAWTTLSLLAWVK